MSATTPDQDKILRFLYERKDAKKPPTISDIAGGTYLDADRVTRIIGELKELGMVNGPPSLLETTEKQLLEVDENLKTTDRGYAEQVILLASAMSKADEAFLATELGYDLEFVSLVGARLRNARIWDGDQVAPETVELWQNNDAGFYLDAGVAMGNMMVVFDGGERKYSLTEGGMRDAAETVKRLSKEKD